MFDVSPLCVIAQSTFWDHNCPGSWLSVSTFSLRKEDNRLVKEQPADASEKNERGRSGRGAPLISLQLKNSGCGFTPRLKGQDSQ